MTWGRAGEAMTNEDAAGEAKKGSGEGASHTEGAQPAIVCVEGDRQYPPKIFCQGLKWRSVLGREHSMNQNSQHRV